MELYQIDTNGYLYISPSIDTWDPVVRKTIDAVFNLNADLDQNIPELINQTLYVYFPFEDHELPDLRKLHALAQLGASLINNGHRVLSHCGMGHNRSALLAGLVLTYLGFSGEGAVSLIQEKRQGALYNKTFANYLLSIPATNLPLPPLIRPNTLLQ